MVYFSETPRGERSDAARCRPNEGSDVARLHSPWLRVTLRNQLLPLKHINAYQIPKLYVHVLHPVDLPRFILWWQQLASKQIQQPQNAKYHWWCECQTPVHCWHTLTLTAVIHRIHSFNKNTDSTLLKMTAWYPYKYIYTYIRLVRDKEGERERERPSRISGWRFCKLVSSSKPINAWNINNSTTESRRFASAVAAHDADAAAHGKPHRHLLEHQGTIIEVLEVQVCHLVRLDTSS